MSIDQKLLAQMRALCEEIGPEDGLSPQQLQRRRHAERREINAKDRRLCGQAARSLNLTLPTAADPRLRALLVLRVAPAPDLRRLCAYYDPGEQPISETQAALEAARPWLRAELARALHRKRVPELRFAPEVRP